MLSILRAQRRHVLPKAILRLPACLPHHRIPIPPKHFSTTSKHHTSPIQRAHASSEIIPGKTLYVSNLPKPYSIPDLTRLFSQFGKVEDINIRRGLHRNGYYASITFSDIHASRRAFDASILNPLKLDFTELKVQLSTPPHISETLRISAEITKEQLEDILSVLPKGEITKYPSMFKRTSVVFASKSDRNKAYRAAEEMIAVGRIRARTVHRSEPIGVLQNPDAERTLFIRDLDISDGEVLRFFEEYHVESVSSRPPLPPVFYIQFDSISTARQARKLLMDKGIQSRYSSTLTLDADGE